MSSASSPHEQKMGGVLSAWRGGYTSIMISLLAVAGFTYMNNPDFAQQALAVKAELAARIHGDTETVTRTLREQMLIPVAIRHFLPVGVVGLLASLAAVMWVSTDQTYLHSWGSIFIQDIVLPLRKKPFTQRQQIRALRLSILGVAIFGFLFSLFFAQSTYILMFFALTGAIWLGGVGSVILGGLYWRRGSTAGAYASLIVGASLGILGFLGQHYWGKLLYPWLTTHAPAFFASMKSAIENLGERLPCVAWKVGPDRFPLSGQEIYFLTMVFSVLAYVVTSRLTSREPFNLERMLHRGKYARIEDQVADVTPVTAKRRHWFIAMMGIDRHFTRGDKLLAWSVFLWSMLHFCIFLAVVIWNVVFQRFTLHTWFLWWKYYTLWLGLFVGGITTIWFTWGGTRDLLRLFKSLKRLQRSELDDGRVIGHVSADEVSMMTALEQRDSEEPDDPAAPS
jgi:SSS family solute:Na+ symporter